MSRAPWSKAWAASPAVPLAGEPRSYLVLSTGKESRGEYAFSTRVAQPQDLQVGARVFITSLRRGGHDSAYRAPETDQEARGLWDIETIVDASELDAGFVTTHNGKRVEVQGIRVWTETL